MSPHTFKKCTIVKSSKFLSKRKFVYQLSTTHIIPQLSHGPWAEWTRHWLHSEINSLPHKQNEAMACPSLTAPLWDNSHHKQTEAMACPSWPPQLQPENNSLPHKHPTDTLLAACTPLLYIGYWQSAGEEYTSLGIHRPKQPMGTTRCTGVFRS